MDSYAAFAPFYDLDLAGGDDDVLLVEQFCARCGSPILELGCGTGRLLVPLSHKGYRLTGVDSSPAMLALAQRKLRAEGLEERVTLLEQDMRSLRVGEGFGLAYCVLNSFLHLLTPEDQLAVLRRVLRCLRPGGLLVLDVFNPDLGRLLEPPGQLVLEKAMRDPESGHTILKQSSRRVDRGRQLIHTTYLLDDVDAEGRIRRTVYSFELRYLFRAELELLLKLGGFCVESVYGSPDLDDFTAESERIIAVGRKPAES